MFDSKEAKENGLVSSVLELPEQALNAARSLAAVIASKSPVAVNITKKSLVYSRDHTVQEGLDHIAMLNGAMLQTVDTQKAISANFAKQKAVFAKL